MLVTIVSSGLSDKVIECMLMFPNLFDSFQNFNNEFQYS